MITFDYLMTVILLQKTVRDSWFQDVCVFFPLWDPCRCIKYKLSLLATTKKEILFVEKCWLRAIESMNFCSAMRKKGAKHKHTHVHEWKRIFPITIIPFRAQTHAACEEFTFNNFSLFRHWKNKKQQAERYIERGLILFYPSSYWIENKKE